MLHDREEAVSYGGAHQGMAGEFREWREVQLFHEGSEYAESGWLDTKAWWWGKGKVGIWLGRRALEYATSNKYNLATWCWSLQAALASSPLFAVWTFAISKEQEKHQEVDPREEGISSNLW